ncbi:RCC1/BLIP-II protein [Ceratobasidium sp. AG-Ba]|nr:RCC1/BLIP-II protein [Ceratobasidium sp. AG-Ba]
MTPRRQSMTVSVEIPVPRTPPGKKRRKDKETTPISPTKASMPPPPSKKRKRAGAKADEAQPRAESCDPSLTPARESSRPPVSKVQSARAPSVARSSRAPSVPRSTRAPSVARSVRAGSRASSVARSTRAGSVPRSPGRPRVTTLLPLKKPPFNPLPAVRAPKRPAAQVFVFGNGDMGQFGLGTDTLGDISRPRLHSWFKDAIEAGVLGRGMHTLAVDELGKNGSQGINDNAALGRPTIGVAHPERPNELIEAEVLETQPMVVQGSVRSMFVLATRSAWRLSSDGLLGFDPSAPRVTQVLPTVPEKLARERFTQITCGTDHVLALTAKGVIVAWGNGQQAQLGRRIIERRKINGLVPHRLALRRIRLVGSGSYHSFAVDDKGEVWAWGLNSMRQCGVGLDEDVVAQPTIVPGLSPSKLGKGRRVVAVSGGEHHSIFLLNDGSVYGCGRCDGFELGLADEHPAMVELRARTQKAKEEAEEDWVKNGGQLSEMPPFITDEYVPEPVQIFFPPPPTASDPDPPLVHGKKTTKIASISVGTRHNLAVSEAGHAYSWGYGNQGQLGLGPQVEGQRVPKRVRSKAMEGFKVIGCAAGGQHCLLMCVKE